jgi:hypothetical protein
MCPKGRNRRRSRFVITIRDMTDGFAPGDILVFQIESGYGLMKVIGIDTAGPGIVWHVKAYRDLFMDVETADLAAASPESLTPEISHVAMTDRAFDSTQVSVISRDIVSADEEAAVTNWRNDSAKPTDRSIRLLLGLR